MDIGFCAVDRSFFRLLMPRKVDHVRLVMARDEPKESWHCMRSMESIPQSARISKRNHMSVIPSQRHLFDISNGIAYFSCAYNSSQLNESERRLLAGACAKSHPWERTPASFFDDAEKIGGLAANILGGVHRESGARAEDEQYLHKSARERTGASPRIVM